MPQGKAVVTLGHTATEQTEVMAERLGVTVVETVRRGLSLLDFLLSLDADEEIVIRNRKDGSLERVRFVWSS